MPSREAIGVAILVAKDPTASIGARAATAGILADALLAAPSAEHARILAAARVMVARHAELGRARDADRWRTFVTWLNRI